MRCGAHCACSSLPTRVEPVKDSLRSAGCCVIAPPTVAAAPVTTLSAPAGSPARSPSAAKASALSGVSSDGFATSVQPAASAAPALRAWRKKHVSANEQGM
jgi:hypothetical protein